jgi:predicted amidohydrolase YtcJ
VKSAGDQPDIVGRHQATIASGERLGAELFPEGKAIDEAYDPALAALEARRAFHAGRTDLLDRSLVQQVIPRQWFAQLKDAMKAPEEIVNPLGPDVARKNLDEAYAAGRLLVTGTDSGNPMVVHGPAVHRELQLWVEAGIPPAAALQGATYNSARLLHADSRIGLIRKGYDASLLLVDGNPLQDISATERISTVFFKGERVDRSSLFEQK